MSKRRKHNRRKRRLENRDKNKNCPAGVTETENYDIGPGEMDEERLRLLDSLGAVTIWFFNEKGERKLKIKA